MTDFPPRQRWQGPVPAKYGSHHLPEWGFGFKFLIVSVPTLIGLSSLAVLTWLVWTQTRDGFSSYSSIWWQNNGPIFFWTGIWIITLGYVGWMVFTAYDRFTYYKDFPAWDEQRVRGEIEQAEKAAREAEEARQAKAMWAQRERVWKAEAARKDRLAELEGQFIRAFSAFSLEVDFAGSATASATVDGFLTAILKQPPADIGLLRASQNQSVRQIIGNGERLPPEPAPLYLMR